MKPLNINVIEGTTRELVFARKSAEAANQAKSDFLANMSHELRTPLHGILGYAQILQRSEGLSKETLHGVDIIQQCGLHLLILINDILDIAKIEARKLDLQPMPLQLSVFIQNIVDICELRAKQKCIEFLFQPSPDLPEDVEVDEKRFRQVLLNLMGNAIKFTEQGSVTFRIDLIQQTENSATLNFQVLDTGVGIAAEDLLNLFQAFEQVGSSQKRIEGTGLGLAISQRIIQLMGSDIQLTSQLGQGSEFSFSLELQLAKVTAQQQANRTQHIVNYQGDRRQVLIIDDHLANRQVLAKLLASIGLSVIEAEDAEKGLDKLQISILT